MEVWQRGVYSDRGAEGIRFHLPLLLRFHWATYCFVARGQRMQAVVETSWLACPRVRSWAEAGAWSDQPGCSGAEMVDPGKSCSGGSAGLAEGDAEVRNVGLPWPARGGYCCYCGQYQESALTRGSCGCLRPFVVWSYPLPPIFSAPFPETKEKGCPMAMSLETAVP